jgi:hypothetical protein
MISELEYALFQDVPVTLHPLKLSLHSAARGAHCC